MGITPKSFAIWVWITCTVVVNVQLIAIEDNEFLTPIPRYVSDVESICLLLFEMQQKLAQIEYTDASGRDIDFHALRHSFISHLALAGVHPAVAQKLARHSSIELTMRYYTHVLHKSEVEAIDALRGLSNASQKDVRRRMAVTNMKVCG
ncbi:MAG: tyrosine-type recombinase/integrase [Phycisphaerales bacterium]|nr:MAG: tyrosine-type recombinase/integrase [Phycisphaerales bacterium]